MPTTSGPIEPASLVVPRADAPDESGGSGGEQFPLIPVNAAGTYLPTLIQLTFLDSRRKSPQEGTTSRQQYSGCSESKWHVGASCRPKCLL